ncbi:hypothetical protein Lal_00032654 [Lupinus albus]|nr:hypothetical protein Lal_00032654 [Lupinus albus]
MWNTLQVTHEGTSDVKRARLNALTHEYELFRSYLLIVNHLVALDKVFANGELTNKVLDVLIGNDNQR